MTDIYCRALGKAFKIKKSETHEYIMQNMGRLPLEILSEKDAAAIPVQLQQNLVNVLITPVSPWMKYFYHLDPEQYIRRVGCPVLAVNGDRDLQVNAEVNLSAIEENLRAGGNNNYYIGEYAGLNHLFQNAPTGLPAEYGQIEETVAPVILEKIGDWILETGNKSAASL